VSQEDIAMAAVNAVSRPTDVVRWLALVVLLQTVSVLSHSGQSEDSDTHDDHSPNNVWTNTPNRDVVCHLRYT